MTARNVVWTFSPVTAGQKLFIVTDPRLIEALLIPVAAPDENGNYGPYVDAALATCDADERPGIFRGVALGDSMMRLVPFKHADVRVTIDPAFKPKLTLEAFAAAVEDLNARRGERFEWKKFRASGRGQNALDALLEDTLGDDAKLFEQGLGEKIESPAAPNKDFLGIALPEGEATQHLLSVLLGISIHQAMIESVVDIDQELGIR